MNPSPEPPPRVGIGDGWRWFTGALDMIRRWPATFLLMGLIAAIIYTLLPLVGRLVLLVVGPAFLAGITLAANAVAQGHKPAVRQMFAMFEQPAQRSEALKLCVPLVLANVIAALILAIALTHLLASQGTNFAALEGHPDKLVVLFRKTLFSAPMHPWWLVALGCVAVAWTFTALAIPEVALARASAFRAMGRSFRLVWGHLAAWIVAVVCLLAVLAIVVLLLQFTRMAIIVQLGAFTAAYAILGPLFYLAWRDLGSAPASAPSPSSHPPAPPPSYLEA